MDKGRGFWFCRIHDMEGSGEQRGSIRDGWPRMAQEGEKWVPGKLKPARADGLIGEGDNYKQG